MAVGNGGVHLIGACQHQVNRADAVAIDQAGHLRAVTFDTAHPHVAADVHTVIGMDERHGVAHLGTEAAHA